MKLDQLEALAQATPSEQYRCLICQDERWVCENHPNKPWEVAVAHGGCGCGGAGMPCGLCNRDTPPAWPPGTTEVFPLTAVQALREMK